MNQMIHYIGNGAYCYSNSVSMLLETIGEEISPNLIEVLSGVGIGAFWLKKEKLIFFSNYLIPPDKGINNALKVLGFDFIEGFSEKSAEFPLHKLKIHLKKSPVVLGPLDMGYLNYNFFQEYINLGGIDHYIIAYKIDKNNIYIHDPDGFPNIPFPINKLKDAWKAEKIQYKKGFYNYWTEPKRIKTPTEKEIYKKSLELFKTIYKIPTNRFGKNILHSSEAIKAFSEYVGRGKISRKQRGGMISFLFSLGAKRSNDFAFFFKKFNKGLSNSKYKQAKLFGECHTLAMQKKWKSLKEKLDELAEAEKEFRRNILSAQKI